MFENINKNSNIKNLRKLGTYKDIFNKGNTFIFLAILLILASILLPQFLKISNIINILRQSTILGLISFGMTLIIISGGIDLSVGANIAVASVISSILLQNNHNVAMAILVPLLATTTIGFINGFIISKGKLQPFLVTLSTMVIARGFAQVYIGGQLIRIDQKGFLNIGRGYLGIIPVPVIILAIFFVLIYFILNRTTIGISILAIGGKEETSYFSGIPVDKIKILLYTISGFLAGLSGLIYTARLGAGEGMAGQYYELSAIAAVMMGGTLMSGGVGTLSGTLWGLLILGVLQNMLNMLNVSSPCQLILTAIIIVGAVIMQQRRED